MSICPKCGKPVSRYSGAVGALSKSAIGTQNAVDPKRQQQRALWDAVLKGDKCVVVAPPNGDINGVRVLTLLGNSYTVAQAFAMAALSATGQYLPETGQYTGNLDALAKAVKAQWYNPYEALLDLAKRTNTIFSAPYEENRVDPEWLASFLGPYKIGKEIDAVCKLKLRYNDL